MDEALVFLRGPDGTLKIHIYLSVNSVYRKVLTLTGEGRSVGSVDYADLDSDGRTDLIVTWQLTGNMNILSVYSLENWSGELLLSSDCSEYAVGDLTGDGLNELLVLRNVGTGSYMADMITLRPDREPQAASAVLSSGIYALQRVSVVMLAGGTPALLAESLLDNGDLVTDVLSCREGSLVNLTLNRSTGVSETRRSYSLVYAQDIDGDGITEIPHPQQLYSQGNGVFWSIAWYKYDAFGRAGLVLTTYHSRAVILSRLDPGGSINDLIVIYTITGENRSERARFEGRFVLLEESSTVYSAQILTPDMDPETISSCFHRIYSDWNV